MTRPYLLALAFGLVLLPGCVAPSSAQPTAAQQLTATKRALDVLSPPPASKAAAAPPLQGIGYAVISAQPGRNKAHKSLMAIRVARMDAMRSLAEQIHGLQVDGRTTIAEAVVQSDTLRATVSGVIRGARIVKIEPQSADIYEVVLEVDHELIAYMLKAARRARS